MERRRGELIAAGDRHRHRHRVERGIRDEPPVDIFVQAVMTGDFLDQFANNAGTQEVDGFDLALPPRATNETVVPRRVRGAVSTRWIGAFSDIQIRLGRDSRPVGAALYPAHAERTCANGSSARNRSIEAALIYVRLPIL